MTDKLETIFQKQKELQEQLGEKYDQAYINKISLALMCEIHEILEETNWKDWKKRTKSFDRNKYLMELVDALHFLINLCLAKNISVDELFSAYLNKNQENIERIKNNY